MRSQNAQESIGKLMQERCDTRIFENPRSSAVQLELKRSESFDYNFEAQGMFLREPCIDTNDTAKLRRMLPKMICNFEQTKVRELRSGIPT